MCLQFADIDDIIGFCDGSNQVKAAVCKSGGTADRAGGEIRIETGVGLKTVHAASAVDSVHVFRVIKTAGAFRDGNVCNAVFSEITDYSADYKGMGRGGKLRTFCHDEIRFYYDFHAGSEILLYI